MFAAACTTAREFTRPVVVSFQRHDEACGSSLGAFVVVNSDGWIVTALHILQQVRQFHVATALYRAVTAAKTLIETNPSLTDEARAVALTQLPQVGPEDPVAYSPWWGFDGVGVTEVFEAPAVDLAIARLQPFDPAWIKVYPTFKDPTSGFDQGTSLCRLGYPFHPILPSFDSASQTFTLPPGSLPAPMFAIDGILSRMLTVNLPAGQPAPSYPLMYLETSSPGIKGQSGGPIFDNKGTVWAIQSQTMSYALDFKPKVAGTADLLEHQFLNVGWGIHAATIVGLMREHGVNFQISAY